MVALQCGVSFTLQQSESAVCIYIFPLFWISLPLSSLQSIEKSACAIQEILASYLFCT